MSKPEIRSLSNYCSFSCQWPELFRPAQYNWINFDLIKCCFEYEKNIGCFEIDLALLGFCVRINIPIVRTAMMDDVSRMARLMEHGMLEVEDVGETAGGLSIKATPQVANMLADKPELLSEITTTLETTPPSQKKERK